MKPKNKFWKILLTTLAIAFFSQGSFYPVFAYSLRYPTEAEIQELMDELPIQTRFIFPSRLEPNLSEFNEFVKAWNQVDPAVAPFLGDWTGYTQLQLGVYPSKTPGRVCLIDYTVDPVLVAGFSVGYVVGDRIETLGELGRAIFIKSGEYLGLYEISDLQPRLYTFGKPAALIPPSELLDPNQSFIDNPEIAARIIAEFEAAGCLSSLPE